MEQIWANESSGKCTIVVMVYVSMKHVQICALQQNKFRPHQSLIFTKNCNQRSKPGQLRFNCTKKSVTKGKILRLKWQNNAKRFSVTTTTCALIIFHWNTFTDTWANLLRWPAYPGSVAQNSTLSTHDLKQILHLPPPTENFTKLQPMYHFTSNLVTESCNSIYCQLWIKLG